MFDILGKNYEINGINNFESNSLSIDTSGFEKGLYFLKLEDINTGQSKTFRLIKQ